MSLVKRYAHRLIAGPKNPHVAHTLQAERIDGAGKRRHVVGNQKYLQYHSQRERSQADHEEPDSSIEQDSPCHEE